MRINKTEVIIKLYKLYQNKDKVLSDLKIRILDKETKIYKINSQKFGMDYHKTTYVDSDHIVFLKTEEFTKLDKIQKELFLRNQLYGILECLPRYAELQYQVFMIDILILNNSFSSEALKYHIDRKVLSKDIHNQIDTILKAKPGIWKDIVYIAKRINDPKILAALK